ncbi:MAG: SURF1 family protein [bacterium]|nr:SURF1 family protein [bacterium]
MTDKLTAKSFQFRLIPTLLTIVIVTVALGLGVWQLERLEWKNGLLARLDSQMSGVAVPLPESVEAKDWEYRRVSLAGQFLYDREFHLGPRVRDGKVGYEMVVPFRRASGGIVLVNRGWIADGLAVNRPEGIVPVEGFVRFPKKTMFAPANDAAKNQWYWVDTKAMDAAAPAFIVDAVAEAAGVYPAGGALRVDIPNDHKNYAIFWFGMAGVMLLIYIMASRQPAAKRESQHAGV